MWKFAEHRLSGRTLATTTTMYRYENGRTYHAFREFSIRPQRGFVTNDLDRRRRVLATERREAKQS